MAIIAAVTAIAATGISLYEGEKSAAAQKKAAAYQRQQGDLQAARQKREAARQARIAYASAQQGAENQGASGSSASAGGLGSIQSQMGSNLSFLDQFNYLSDQASIQLGKASTYAVHAQTFAGISSIAGQVFGAKVGAPKSGGSGGVISGGSGQDTLGG